MTTRQTILAALAIASSTAACATSEGPVTSGGLVIQKHSDTELDGTFEEHGIRIHFEFTRNRGEVTGVIATHDGFKLVESISGAKLASSTLLEEFTVVGEAASKGTQRFSAV